MDLRLLTTFKAVADTGSVSAAAGRLHTSQPALSRQIQSLERELGIALFVRHKRRLDLTAAGRKFLDAATDVMASVEAAGSLATTLAAGRLTDVRMAAPGTTLADVLAPFLAGLLPDDPLITVEESTYGYAVASVRSGVDLAVLTAPPPRTLSSCQVAVLPVWAYVALGHAWADRSEVSITELADHRLVVLEPTARARQLVDQVLVEEGLAASDLVQCQNPQVAQALAAAGRGVAVLSDDPRFGLRPLHVRTRHGLLSLSLYAAWDPTHHATGELQRLAERLRDFCARRYEQESVSVTEA